MKNLIVRTLSGAVMLAVLLGATLWSPWSFTALMALVLAGGLWEFYALSRRCGAEPQRMLGFSIALAVFLAGIAAVTPEMGEAGRWVVMAKIFSQYFLLLALPLLLIVELFRFRERPILNIGATLLGVVYVALPLAMILYIPRAFGGWNPWMVLFFIFTIWANDVFAYLVGMAIGRHRLCERISPKKSWEGFFGGVAGAVAMGYAASVVLDHPATLWCGLAFVASITGVLGDLVESMFKRRADVKDSGNLIPGHGGVLDRFDALLLATPFVCVCLLVYTVLHMYA